MPKPFSVDATLFKVKAKKLVKQLKIDESKFVREQAGMLAQTLCKVVPPMLGEPKLSGKGYGGNPGAGKKAIMKDMKAMFRVREIGYLKSVAEITGKTSNIRQQTLRNKKGIPYVIDVAQINWWSVDEALYFHAKNQLPGSGRARNRTKAEDLEDQNGRWQGTNRMWITESIWNSIRMKLWSRVGIAKSSFAKVAVNLGRKNPPKWINRHFAYVYAPITITKKPYTVKFSVYEKGLEAATRRLNEVERFRMVAMVKRLEYLVKANAKKAGFKTS